MGPANPDKDPLVGRVLQGSYEITRLLGEGGMGRVYEAVQVRLRKKRFAIKFVHPRVAQDQIYARFQREAEIATELGHPNIIDVLDFNVTEEGSPYMVMEFLEGEDLGARLAREGRLELRETARIIAQVSSGLQAAHDRGIVHRDIKPENIFLLAGEDGVRVKVLDFGISKIRHSLSVVTQENLILGTPNFMSPEQATGTRDEIDHATDIFALGAITYLLLSGRHAFDAPTPQGVLYQVVHEQPLPLGELAVIPSAACKVIERALAKDKRARYQRVADFSADLLAALRQADPTLVGAGAPASSDAPVATAATMAANGQPRAGAQTAQPTTLSGTAGNLIDDRQLDVLPRGRAGRWALVGLGAAGLIVAGLVLWRPAGGPPGDEPAKPLRPAAAGTLGASKAAAAAGPSAVRGAPAATGAAAADARPRALHRVLVSGKRGAVCTARLAGTDLPERRVPCRFEIEDGAHLALRVLRKGRVLLVRSWKVEKSDELLLGAEAEQRARRAAPAMRPGERSSQAAATAATPAKVPAAADPAGKPPVGAEPPRRQQPAGWIRQPEL